MDVKYINPFLDAVNNTFETMCGQTPKRCSLALKKRGEEAPGDISGMIGFVGDLNGLIAITFPADMAVSTVGKIVGERFSEINDVVEDGVAELTNIIAGNAKSFFRSQSFDVDMSLPSLIVGEGHSVSTPASIPSIIVGFQVEDMSFWLEICLKRD